jgi:hypothetical protein
VRYFWYISKGKLDSLSSQNETIFERVRAALSLLIKAEAKLPVASVGIELKSNESSVSLIQLLGGVEKKLRDQNLVKTAEEASSGGVPLFFSFGGPSGRLIREGQFWSATIDGTTAVLLAGSAAHCVGGAVPEKPPLSPSINPIASMDAMFENKAGEGQEERASFTWAQIVKDSLYWGTSADLPVSRGIAIFAARFTPVPWQLQRSGYKGRLNQILVGSPIYVEQITS